MQAVQAEQDHAHPRTMGDNDPNGAASNSCHVLRRVVTKLLTRRPNMLAQIDTQNRAKD
jgi:hypothetical protein